MSYQHWSTEQILNLIEVYRSHECLWKNSSDDYGDREKKDRAWDVIAKCVGTDVRSVERKIKTLKTQFANYHKLALKKASERGDGFKKPKWFAYGSLEFLLEGRAPKHVDSLLKNECLVRLSRDDCDAVPAVPSHAWGLPSLQHEMDFTDGDPDSETMETGSCTPVQTTVHNTDLNCQFGSLLRDVLNFAKSVQQSNARDEYSIFGEHIACRLRKISDTRTRLLAQDRIHSVLFSIEVGDHSRNYISENSSSGKKQLNTLDTLNVNKDKESISCSDASDELLVTPSQESESVDVDSSNSTQRVPELAGARHADTKKQSDSSTAQETPPGVPTESLIEELQ
ncbi:MADF domain [Trinorchestia longiramus]|nr:MADF domain [Trinorchestia longiramus]